MSTPTIPDPGNAQTAFAAEIAAHYEFIEIATHRPDGVVLPPPRPEPSVVRQISLRLRREERWRQHLELAIQLQGRFPPDVKGGGHAGK